MKKQIMKLAAVLLTLIILCLIFTPITHANIKNKSNTLSISTDYFGLNTKETQTSLTETQLENITTILNSLQTHLKTASTNTEANNYVEETIDFLYEYGIFGDNNIKKIKELCTRQSRLIPDIELPNNIKTHIGAIGGDNAFCVLLSHIKGYVYDHGLLYILAVLVALSALPFIVIFYPLGAIFNFVSEQIFSLQHKKPFIPPFPHRVETRYNESSSNLISRGLYGRVDNDYTEWGFRIDAFTGVRINIDRDDALRINESYYLGSALFVSWNYDGPH